MKEQLIVAMYQEGKSMGDISKQLGVNVGVVHRILKRNGVQTRTVKEGLKIKQSQKDKVKLAPSNVELIIGNLLGDGSVRIAKGCRRAYYSHTDKNRDYLEWLQAELEKDGVTFSPIHETVSRCFNLQSHALSVFNPFKEMFYPNGKRIVPKNIKLTPIILRQWFISDGSVATCGGRNISKVVEDPNPLLEQLKSIIGEGVTYQKPGRFYISKHLTDRFLKYIGSCPVDCYKYKWS